MALHSLERDVLLKMLADGISAYLKTFDARVQSYNRLCFNLRFHFLSSTRATVLLWTASGPSAILRDRKPTRIRASGKSSLTPAPPNTYSLER